MNTNEYLEKHKKIEHLLNGEYKNRPLAPHMECKDGFRMSVQVSETHYCIPRLNDADYYQAVEVGYPSEQEELLMPFVEDADNPTSTVYAYVPVEVVDFVIKKHGGIKR